MEILIYLIIYLIVEQFFRRLMMNPVLEKNKIEPFNFRKHAKINAMTDYIKYWKYSPKDTNGILGILFSIILQIFLIWIFVSKNKAGV